MIEELIAYDERGLVPVVVQDWGSGEVLTLAYMNAESLALTRETGETLTRTVTEALRERYERLHKHDAEALGADIRAIADRAAAHIKGPYLDLGHAEYLYDEHGLPK